MTDPGSAVSYSQGAHGKLLLQDPVTGLFVKGTAGGPGRPKRDFHRELVDELEMEERHRKITFFRHRWKQAFKSDRTAADMMSYLLPRPKPEERVDAPNVEFSGPTQITIHGHPPQHTPELGLSAPASPGSGTHGNDP